MAKICCASSSSLTVMPCRSASSGGHLLVDHLRQDLLIDPELTQQLAR